jgi:hypothetical protein
MLLLEEISIDCRLHVSQKDAIECFGMNIYFVIAVVAVLKKIIEHLVFSFDFIIILK